jgi:transposase
MDPTAENRALREENEELRVQLDAATTQLDATTTQLDATTTQLDAATTQLDAVTELAEVAIQVNRRLQHEIELLERQLKGPKSERFIDPNQLPLPLPPGESEAETGSDGEPASETASEDPEDGEKPKRRRRKNKGRRDVSKMNDLRTVEHVSLVEDRHCPCGCGAEAVTIGEDVSWRLERIPAEIVRHKNVQEKVAFPDHREQGLVTAPAPVAYALPKAMCGNQLLAQVAIDKYADHLPLFRQSQRFGRQGFELHRSTLSRWMMELGELLRPVVNVLALEVRSGSWLRADATGMPVLDRSRTKGKAHHGHFWAWGNYDSVVFSYTSNKKATTVAALFEGFQGTVVIDGASDFNLLEKVDGVTRAACWAHARRYFYDAIKTDAVRATRALGSIRQLFMAERVVMGTPVERRQALRDELCRPIVEGFRRWVDEEVERVIPRDPIHAALNYVRNQWDRLVVFLDVPSIPCHNNDSERDLRRPVKGKHNYNFAGSPRGARVATVYYTLIGTCLLQGIDPRRYLVEILGRLDEPASRLTPQAVRDQWLPAPGDTSAESTT